MGLLNSLVVFYYHEYKKSCEWFGDVKEEKMLLNEVGQITNKYWLEIPKHFLEIELDHYIIMPNHVHGIIIINSHVETCHGMSLQINYNQFSKPIKNSISVIINQFKGSVKRYCNKNNCNSFHWQPSFYDRIIRNEKELFNIRKYILQNHLKWDYEKEIPENILNI